MNISKVKVGSTTYDIKDADVRTDLSTFKSNTITSADINELFGIVENNGTVPTLINSDTLIYLNVGYTATAVSASSSTLTLAGTDPIYLVTVSANLSSVTLTANPSAGHSCHVIFVTDSNDSNEYTVAIAHDATNRVCPAGEDLSFTVPASAGGYVEVDFLNANNKVYVRGV